MILDRLSLSSKYEPLHLGFAAAFEFLRRRDLAELPDGRYEIVDEMVFALVSRGDGRDGVSPLEAHRKFIDVQFAIAGEERIGWRTLADSRPLEEFDASRDIGFFRDEPAVWLALQPGDFAVFFPTDAHAPLAGTGAIHKAVVKVAVDCRR